LQECN